MQRTNQQSRALHKFFSLLSDALNQAGLEMQIVLKPGTQLWWTPDSVKNYLWRPLQDAMLGKVSTKELDKQMDIDKVYEQLMHILAEKHGLEWIDFPHDPNRIGNFDLVDKSLVKKESW